MTRCLQIDDDQLNSTTSNCTWNSTGIEGAAESGIPVSRIVITALLFAVVFITIIGNIVVLLAFIVVRRLTKVIIILNTS